MFASFIWHPLYHRTHTHHTPLYSLSHTGRMHTAHRRAMMSGRSSSSSSVLWPYRKIARVCASLAAGRRASAFQRASGENSPLEPYTAEQQVFFFNFTGRWRCLCIMIGCTRSAEPQSEPETANKQFSLGLTVSQVSSVRRTQIAIADSRRCVLRVCF